jgi:hypothetical protein
LFNFKTEKMNLVQNLSIGLGLACIMMMSSCSKEDAQMPEPKVESGNASSNLKTETIPWIAPTKGYVGINTFPNFWERYDPIYHSDPAAYPAGTSSLTSLWGNPSLGWVQSLSAIPAQNNASFVTVLTSSKFDNQKRSLVKSKIRFLVPGSEYSLTFYVASTLTNAKGRNTVTPTFAKQCEIGISSPLSTPTGYLVDLTNYKNTWVQKTITFKAHASEMDFTFGASPAQEGKYAYAHIFVGQDAIVKVN